MKKNIILSVNDNPYYLYYAPLCAWAWRKFGWEVHIMYLGKRNDLFELVSNNINITFISKQEGYRDDTVTQVSRLYASCMYSIEESYLMTGDIDMIPLSDYWRPDINAITVYGHDLTDYTHYPICYIGMSSSKWMDVMKLTNRDFSVKDLIKRDLDSMPQASDPDFYKYWFTDQDLITKRLNDYGKEKITFIDRGKHPSGYANGRVDRGDWRLNHHTFIDAHLLRDIYKNEENLNKTMKLLYTAFPNNNFDWLVRYTQQFKTLLNG